MRNPCSKTWRFPKLDLEVSCRNDWDLWRGNLTSSDKLTGMSWQSPPLAITLILTLCTLSCLGGGHILVGPDTREGDDQVVGDDSIIWRAPFGVITLPKPFTWWCVAWKGEVACFAQKTKLIMLLITPVKHQESPISVISFPGIFFLDKQTKFPTLRPWTKYMQLHGSPLLCVKVYPDILFKDIYLNILFKHQSLFRNNFIHCTGILLPLTELRNVTNMTNIFV